MRHFLKLSSLLLLCIMLLSLTACDEIPFLSELPDLPDFEELLNGFGGNNSDESGNSGGNSTGNAGNSNGGNVTYPSPAPKDSAGLAYQHHDDFIYGYILTGIGSCKDSYVQVPAKYSSKKIGILERYAFQNCTQMTGITLPEGMSIIRSGAFANCENLVTVSIPSSITRVYDSAFYNCPQLKYNIYGNACYLGNTQNPYLILVKPVDGVTECTVHADAKLICAGAFMDNTTIEAVYFEDANASWATSSSYGFASGSISAEEIADPALIAARLCDFSFYAAKCIYK